MNFEGDIIFLKDRSPFMPFFFGASRSIDDYVPNGAGYHEGKKRIFLRKHHPDLIF